MLVLLTQILGLYLTLTLASTSLAKLKRFTLVAIDVSQNLRLPLVVGRLLLVVACIAELWLAVFVAFNMMRMVVAGTTAAMFLTFGAYRVVTIRRTGKASCNCAGTSDTSSDNAPAIAGFLASNVFLAAASLAWGFLARSADRSSLSWLPLLGLAVPGLALLIGQARQRQASHRRARQHQPSLAATDFPT
jgi:hypothetical protein